MLAVSRHDRSPRCAAAVCLGFALSLALVTATTAQTAGTARAVPEVEPSRREAVRDSLRAEIARYAEAIAELKSSVEDIDSDEAPRDERFVEIEESAAAISEAIGMVAAQLSELELKVDEGRISLSDGRGGRVTVEIPENFSDHINKGIGELSQMLLDTTLIGEIETGFHFDRRGRTIDVAPVAPAPPPPPRKVVEGGVVKFMDDLEIGADEVILGDVVAVMGDALIEGHVQGDLVVVVGDVTLAETAVIEGEVVAVFGRFDRADGARVGSLTVINPGDTYLPSALSGEAGDWIAFWGWQALFLLLVFLVLLLVALAPRERLNRVFGTLTTRPAESLGVGLLMALIGHFVLLGLGTILVITLIGIPVAILVLVAVALIDLMAVGLASLVVGRQICARSGWRCGNPWREVLLGMVVLHLPAFLAALFGAAGLPFFVVLLFSWAGRLVKFAAFCFGLGALVLGRFGNASAPTTLPTPLDPLPETSGHGA